MKYLKMILTDEVFNVYVTETSDEMTKWCRENIGEKNGVRLWGIDFIDVYTNNGEIDYYNYTESFYVFSNKNDAILFKLTWTE